MVDACWIPTLLKLNPVGLYFLLIQQGFYVYCQCHNKYSLPLDPKVAFKERISDNLFRVVTICNNLVRVVAFCDNLFNFVLFLLAFLCKYFYCSFFTTLPSNVSLYQYFVSDSISYSGRLSKYSNSNTKRGSSSLDFG